MEGKQESRAAARKPRDADSFRFKVRQRVNDNHTS